MMSFFFLSVSSITNKDTNHGSLCTANNGHDLGPINLSPFK